MNKASVPEPDDVVPPTDRLAAAILGASEVVLFEDLYVAHAAEARRLARAILGDTELAADAVHAGFVEMLRYVVAGRRWHDPGDARGVVLRNVRWAALKAHRARRRVSLGLDGALDDASDDVVWAQAEVRALTQDIVSRLGSSYQVAIRLRYIDGLSNVESAQRLEINVDAFESRVRQALRAARRVAHAAGLAQEAAAN